MFGFSIRKKREERERQRETERETDTKRDTKRVIDFIVTNFTLV
jgi:hypothetical protein